MIKTKEELQQTYKTADDLLAKINQCSGKSFGLFDINNRLANQKNKGALGQIVEEGIFGYAINSDSAADFDYLGLELKTTGVIQNKNKTISAKERLPLDALNYFRVSEQSFINSDMWIKSKGLLLVLYKYIFGSDYRYMPIIKGLIHRFSAEDLMIMMHDYNIIANKIKEGKAETISEGDTMYLGACTAGIDSNDLVKQPYSNVLAKRRKFCLKQSYMTQIIRNNVTSKEVEHLFSVSDVEHYSFEMAVMHTLKPYFGMSEYEIRKCFSINIETKSKFERYIAKMLNVSGKVNETDEFQKSDLELKTIRIEENGRIIESMSFPAFRFIDIVEQEWEDSEFRNMLENKKFLFAIFRKRNGEYYFDGIKFWNIPIETLDSKGKEVFEELQRVLKSGNVVKGLKTFANGKVVRETNFPGMSFNGFIHIRPHGKDANDVDELPVEDKLLKTKFFTIQCFWLNNSYVKSVLEDNN